MSAPAPVLRFCPARELAEGQVRSRLLGDRPVAVARLRGRLHAFGALCPHQHADLSGGLLEEGGITCPDHLWRFDLASGECTMIAGACIPVFVVREEDGWIVVELDR